MRTWTAVGLTVFAAGCGIISGLDDLGVPDASADDASTDGATSIDGPSSDAQDDTDAGPSTLGSQVMCGQDTCSGSKPYCCRSAQGVSNFGYTCIGASQVCPGLIIRCDSADDCKSGEVCCLSGYTDGGCLIATNVLCTVADQCTGQSVGILCGDAGQCAAGHACTPTSCSVPGYDVCK